VIVISDAATTLVVPANVVNVPAAGVVPPITASTVPALISAVVATKLPIVPSPVIFGCDAVANVPVIDVVSCQVVVNVPAAAEAPPMIAPSTVPPLMSTVVTLPKSVQVPVSEPPPVALRVVAVIAAALAPPMIAPSTVPPFISTVVTVPRSDQVPVNEPPPVVVSVPAPKSQLIAADRQRIGRCIQV
jgi:hypothetical protein